MNLYISVMNEAVHYIEENINKPLTLQNMAKQFYLSEFHFSRLFKMITGVNLKYYITGRKLTRASESLKERDSTVIKVALDYGYEYPEVFSRAFKKQFGVSPSLYKNGMHEISAVPIASVVIRDFSNIKGTVAVKETSVELQELWLQGISIDINENDEEFNSILDSVGSTFMREYAEGFEDGKLFSTVNCHEDDSGEYTVFWGSHIKPEYQKGKLITRKIPAGWYACFRYYGDMLTMRTTFIEDLYRWIIIKEVELEQNGIGMLNIYDKQDIRRVQILVPIKKPK